MRGRELTCEMIKTCMFVSQRPIAAGRADKVASAHQRVRSTAAGIVDLKCPLDTACFADH